MKLIENQILNKKVTLVTLFLRFFNTIGCYAKFFKMCVCAYIYNTYLVKSSVTL